MFGPTSGAQLDVVSVRLVPPADPYGRGAAPVDVETGTGFLASVRKLLIAAAKASGEERLAHYGQANRGLARRYLEATTLGAVTDGGATVEIHSLGAAVDGGAEAELSLLPPVDQAPPLPRIVGQRLLEAVEALVSGLEDHAASGHLDRIGCAVGAGVSVELCDAVAGLVASGRDVAIGFRPAGPATDGSATGDPATDGSATDGSATGDPATTGPTVAGIVVVPGHLGPVLEEVAEALRTAPGGTEATITGEVTDLTRRDQPDGSGTVTLRAVDADTAARTVKVRVGPRRYRDAIAAHRSNRTIVVRGILVRQANTNWIHAPVSFRVGPEPPAPPADEPLPLDLGP